MIFRAIALFVLLVVGLGVQAQNRHLLDSLHASLARDSSATPLLEIGKEWLGKPDSAKQYLSRGMATALQQRDSFSISLAHLYLSMLDERNGALDSAEWRLGASRKLSQSRTPREHWAEQEAQAAILIMRRGRPDEALLLLQNDLQILRGGPAQPQFPLLMAATYLSFSQSNLRQCQVFAHQAEALMDETTPRRLQSTIFNNLGNVYTHLGQSELAECYLRECLSIRKAMQDKTGEINALLNISVLKNRTGDTPTAIRLMRSVAPRYLEMRDTLTYAGCHQNLGLFYRKSGMLDSAHAHLDTAWHAYLEIGREDRTATVLNSKALIYQDEANYPEALQLFFDGLQLARLHRQRPTEGLCLANIARMLQELGMTKESQPYAAEALKILDSTEVFVFKGGLYREMGHYHLAEWNQDLAERCFRKVIAMGKESQNASLEAEGWLGLADLHTRLGEWPRALEYGQAAQLLLPGSTQSRLQVKVLGFMARAHEGLGSLADAQKLAKDWAQAAYSAGLMQEYTDALFLRSRLASLAADFRNAYHWGDLAAHLRDSLSGATQQRTLAGLQSIYDLREKQQAIRDLKEDLKVSELKRERQALRAARAKLFQVIGVLAFLVLVLVVYIVMRRRILKREAENLQLRLKAAEQQAQLEQQLRVVQQQAIQTRMSPHFTFNCLNSIQAFILRKDQESATLYLARFARLVRMAFEYADAPSITLEKEMEFLSLYCELENLRQMGKVNVQIDVAPDIDPEIASVPPLVIQPLVENAFQHAFPPSISSPELSIRVSKSDTHQIWTITDNGIGPQNAQPTKFGMERTPSGLAKTKERLALLGTHDGQPQATMDISALTMPDGTVVGTRAVVRFLVG